MCNFLKILSSKLEEENLMDYTLETSVASFWICNMYLKANLTKGLLYTPGIESEIMESKI